MTTFQISLTTEDAFAELRQNDGVSHGELKPTEEISFLFRFPLAYLLSYPLHIVILNLVAGSKGMPTDTIVTSELLQNIFHIAPSTTTFRVINILVKSCWEPRLSFFFTSNFLSVPFLDGRIHYF